MERKMTTVFCCDAQQARDVNMAMEAHEGCNMYGWLDLQRVAGNFRVSVHVEDFFMLSRVSALPSFVCSRRYSVSCAAPLSPWGHA
jgi:hypothetical protein